MELDSVLNILRIFVKTTWEDFPKNIYIKTAL